MFFGVNFFVGVLSIQRKSSMDKDFSGRITFSVTFHSWAGKIFYQSAKKMRKLNRNCIQRPQKKKFEEIFVEKVFFGIFIERLSDFCRPKSCDSVVKVAVNVSNTCLWIIFQKFRYFEIFLDFEKSKTLLRKHRLQFFGSVIKTAINVSGVEFWEFFCWEDSKVLKDLGFWVFTKNEDFSDFFESFGIGLSKLHLNCPE